MCFLWYCEIIMRLPFLQIMSKRIRWLERLLDGLYLSPFLLESVLFPMWTESSMKVLCGIWIFSKFEELIHNPSIQVQLEYHQNAIEYPVNNIEFHLYFYSTQVSSLSCLQRCVVTTSRHWNLCLLHVRTYSTIRISLLPTVSNHQTLVRLDRNDVTWSWLFWSKSLPHLGWAWIVIHVFSLLWMTFLMFQEASFGTRVREAARVSCPSFLGASGYLSLSLCKALLHFILEDFRASHYWIGLMCRECVFHSQTLGLSCYHNISFVSRSTDWWIRNFPGLREKTN